MLGDNAEEIVWRDSAGRRLDDQPHRVGFGHPIRFVPLDGNASYADFLAELGGGEPLGLEIVGQLHADGGILIGYGVQEPMYPNRAINTVCRNGYSARMAKNRILALRKARGLSQDGLAQRVNTTKMTIQRLETGARKLTHDWMLRLAPALGTSPSSLIESSVPVVGYVGAGGETVFMDDNAVGSGLYEVDSPDDISGDVIGLEVRGESQWPMFRDGYVVLIGRRDDGIDERAVNDWAVCRLDDGRTLLKILRRGATPDTFNLLSINAEPIENVRLEWATPVKGWLTNAR